MSNETTQRRKIQCLWAASDFRYSIVSFVFFFVQAELASALDFEFDFDFHFGFGLGFEFVIKSVASLLMAFALGG